MLFQIVEFYYLIEANCVQILFYSMEYLYHQLLLGYQFDTEGVTHGLEIHQWR